MIDLAKRQGILGGFFRLIWRVAAGIYALLILVFLLAVPVSAYLLFFGGSGVTVEDNVALVWAPTGDLIEQSDMAAPDALVRDLIRGPEPQSVVRDLVEALDRAAGDDRITLAFLKLDQLGAASAGQLQDLTDAIDRFRESGKRVVAWSPSYNQAQYELAAHADHVYLDPMGYVFIDGYSVYRKYFAEGLDKLGVDINVFRVGEYKSFVEPFLRNDMSPPARAANRAWLESLWKVYLNEITGVRELTSADIEGYVTKFDSKLAEAGGDAAAMAKAAGLVDEIASLEATREAMREIVGTDDEHGSFRQINHFQYLSATESAQPEPRTENRIGLVVVEGPIVDGESMRGAAGGETVAKLVAEARRDDSVAALLLRVNSPGGSVYASERIRREVALTREAGKPVVVSMAGTAASGGYWISMNADQIWAQPATITGSIGVFGIIPTYGKPLAELGIHTDGVGTTPLSGALRGDRPLSPMVKRIIQSGIEHTYDQFIGRVAEARDMQKTAVDEIAQGRVWSGADAQRIGLVDSLGGFEQALTATAELAGLQPGDYDLKPIRPPSNWQALMRQLLSSRAGLGFLPDWITRLPTDPAFDWLRHGLTDPRGFYAHCFCELAPADGRP